MRIYLLGNHFENCFFPHCNPFEKRYPTIPKSAPNTISFNIVFSSKESLTFTAHANFSNPNFPDTMLAV